MDHVYDERAGAYVEPQDEPTTRLLRQMIVQNHHVSESGHRRLRDAVKELEGKVTACDMLEMGNREHLNRIDEVLKRPIEATAIRYDLKTVIALLAICASIVGGQKWATGDLKEQLATQAKDVALLNAKMDAIKQHAEDVTKLQDARADTVTRELTRIGGQATMIDTRLTNLVGRK